MKLIRLNDNWLGPAFDTFSMRKKKKEETNKLNICKKPLSANNKSRDVGGRRPIRSNRLFMLKANNVAFEIMHSD